MQLPWALSPLSAEALLHHAGCNTGSNISMCLVTHATQQGWGLHLGTHSSELSPRRHSAAKLGRAFSQCHDGPGSSAPHRAQPCSEALHTPRWSQGADKPCVWACRLWAANDLQHIKTIEVGKAWVTDCLYLPSARRLVCTSADRAVRRQDAPTVWDGGCARTLRGSKGSGLHCSRDVPS